MYAIAWGIERSLTELRVRTKKHDRSIDQSCGTYDVILHGDGCGQGEWSPVHSLRHGVVSLRHDQ